MDTRRLLEYSKRIIQKIRIKKNKNYRFKKVYLIVILKYANYNEEYEDNLLPEIINDLILTLVETEWEQITLHTFDNNNPLTITDNNDNELFFEEDYLKYINEDTIEYLDYVSINKISLKLKKTITDDDWIGNRIIF